MGVTTTTATHLPTVMRIGIDPGVNTGVAVTRRGVFVAIDTVTILEAMDRVLAIARGEPTKVWWEDARLRTWFGSKGREALQGAGSIKRDCGMWEEFFARHAIDNTPIAPAGNSTKLKAEEFRKLTGWQGRCNGHGRDAAMLIAGRGV